MHPTHYNIVILIVILMSMFAFSYSAAAAEQTAEKSSHNQEEGGIFKAISKWLNFAALIAILYYFLVRILNIPASFKKLSEGIAHSIKDSSESKEAALKQIEEIKNRLSNLESEVEQIKAEAMKSTEQEKIKISAETENEIKRIQELTNNEIDWKMKEAIQQLKNHTIEIAASMSEKMIQSELKNEDQERLIEKFIVDLRNKN